MAVSIELKNFTKAMEKFSQMENNLKNPSIPMKVIGQKGSKDILEHFNKTTGPGGVKWKAIKPRKNGTTKPLNYKGFLRNTMQVKPGKFTVTLIKNIKYAAVHNYGYDEKNITQREFMYINKAARESMTKTLIRFITGAFK